MKLTPNMRSIESRERIDPFSATEEAKKRQRSWINTRGFDRGLTPLAEIFGGTCLPNILADVLLIDRLALFGSLSTFLRQTPRRLFAISRNWVAGSVVGLFADFRREQNSKFEFYRITMKCLVYIFIWRIKFIQKIFLEKINIKKKKVLYLLWLHMYLRPEVNFDKV